MNKENYELATFGAGCFWGVESAFKKIEGVIETNVGYMGGELENPTYQEVCYSNTGHAEICQVKYDPEVVTYLELLKLFFEIHDPTQLNRQGLDIGEQYRSVIFYHSEKQKEIAEATMKKIIESNIYPRKIVTEISEAARFYSAEDYHQDYYTKRGITPHCGIGSGKDLDFLLEE